MWESSNCSAVRTSTISVPSSTLCCTWRGVSGTASIVRRSSGPRLICTMARKFGGWGASPAMARSTNRPSSSSCRRSLWAASNPTVEEIFMSIPGPPHSEPPRWAGHTSVPGGRLRSFWCSERKMLAGAVLLLHREVGAGDVAHEQAVAGEHRPRLGPARGVDERERGVLGPVAGRVDRAHAQHPELELEAVVERLVLVVDLGLAVDVDRRPGGGGQAPVAGDVVGVVVGLEHVRDVHAHVAGQREVLVDVELGVDHGGDAGVLVADQVGGAAEVVVDDLAEDHAGSIAQTAATSPGARTTPASSSPPSPNGPTASRAGAGPSRTYAPRVRRAPHTGFRRWGLCEDRRHLAHGSP